jgi:nucleotide-binding universal stress UspA family protein
MYSDLVIGFDGSPAGRDAIAFGRRLAIATGARPTVLYVHPRATATEGARATGGVPTWREAVEQVLDQARELLADVPDAAYQGVVERSAAHALRSAAAVGGTSLLVLGSTHRSGLGRLAPGTTADHVLHRAPCAVAVAPPGLAARAARPFGLVAAAVDGGEESDRVARVAARIARSAGATLRLVHVIDHHSPAGPLYTGGVGDAALSDAVRERATETLERATAAAGEGCRIEQRAYEGHAAEQLILRSTEFDLLVVGSRGYGAVRRVLPGSVSAKVLREADCPVLVLPRQAPEGRDGSVADLTGGWSEDRGAAVTP